MPSWNLANDLWNYASYLWNAEPPSPIPTEPVWSTTRCIWDRDKNLWNEVYPVCEEIVKHHGGNPEEGVKVFDKLDKKLKRKVLRVIMHYRNQEFSQQREVRDDLTVTTEDMRMLIDKYNEWKKLTEVKVSVNNIRVE